MPRPTATIRSACDRSTACLASLNGASGFWRIVAASIGSTPCARAAGAAPRFAASARNAPIWKVTRCGAGPRRRRPRSACPGTPAARRRRAPSFLIAVHVGDERAARAAPRAPGRSRASGRCAAGKTCAGCSGFDQRAQRHARSRPRCSARAPASSTDDHFGRLGRGELRASRVDAGSEHRDLDRLAGLLRRGDRFPRGAIELPVPLFGDDQDHADHPRFVAQLLHQRLRGLGRRAGEHLRLLPLLREIDADDPLRRVAAAAGATLRISFFFAAMMPLSVA